MYFNWSCVILATTYESIQIRVQGTSQIGEAWTNPEQRAGGLHGAVTVATKSISAGEKEFVVVHTYKELSQLYEEVKAYDKHLSDTINRYDRGINGRTTVDVIDAYKKIREDNIPIACALGNILSGVNTARNKVWLWTSGVPPSRVSAVIAPIMPPRPSTTIAPSAPSAPPREPPPPYKEAMLEIETDTAISMSCRDGMNAYYEANQIN